MRKWSAVLLVVAGILVITRLLPFSSFFRMLDTMVHEFGHAAATLLLSGHVERIELNSDHSGVTYSALSTRWRMILASLAGYPAASLFSVLLMYLFHKRKQAVGLMILTVMAAVMLLFFVRSGYGVWWLSGFGVLNIVILFLGPKVQNFYYLFLAVLALTESLVSTLFLLLAALIEPATAGDAANLQRLTGLPAVLWAGLFAAVALWCVRAGLQLLVQERHARTPARIQG
ncbi:M50 family metallopeptidase [Paenibacillus sp. 1P07SE]|uniref:M50 family metallopeptidase n=1 Tax=Paenibacillus sp. 1P07SE TaxID=3132209 RepID=UPI0039A55B35